MSFPRPFVLERPQPPRASIVLEQLARDTARRRAWGEAYWTARDLFYPRVSIVPARPPLEPVTVPWLHLEAPLRVRA